MGAVKPWHLLCSLVCLVGVTGIVAAIVLTSRARSGRPPRD